MGKNSKEQKRNVECEFIKFTGLDGLNNINGSPIESGGSIDIASLISNPSFNSGKIKMKKHRSKKWRNGIKSKKK